MKTLEIIAIAFEGSIILIPFLVLVFFGLSGCGKNPIQVTEYRLANGETVRCADYRIYPCGVSLAACEDNRGPFDCQTNVQRINP